jgi:hypothetical protein
MDDAVHAAEETDAPTLSAGLIEAEEQAGRAAAEVPAASGERVAPQVDLSMILGRAAAPAVVDAPDATEAGDATDAVDVVLAEGGFLPVAGDA